MTSVLPLGPVMLDLRGTEPDAEELEALRHPMVGGVILFTRNYRDPAQLTRLTAAIRQARQTPLLVAVDHEGGRVQRFREGFTRLPAMGRLGALWSSDPAAGRRAAHETGVVLALELRACGVDFSFAPVLDLDHGRSGVIGDRAFHAHPDAVTELAGALVSGLAEGGMGAVGKHFPGHGYAEADSHTDAPVDPRALADVEAADLRPFSRLAAAGLGGVMPAHVVYPEVDARPAGYSQRWLQDILRTRLGFQGVIFSDDLSMVGAHAVGPITVRAHAALEAGCDMVLVCNEPAAARELLARLDRPCSGATLSALERLRGRPGGGPRRHRSALDWLSSVDLAAPDGWRGVWS